MATSSPSKTNLPVSKGENPVRGLQDDVNRLFNHFFGEFMFSGFDRFSTAMFTPSPVADVTETDTGYQITAELPGVDAKDIEVTVADGYVTLKGEKSHKSTTEGKGFVRQERSYGSFRRVFTLPTDADLDHAEAEIKDGVLTLNIKRRAENTSEHRKITVREVA